MSLISHILYATSSILAQYYTTDAFLNALTSALNYKNSICFLFPDPSTSLSCFFCFAATSISLDCISIQQMSFFQATRSSLSTDRPERRSAVLPPLPCPDLSLKLPSSPVLSSVELLCKIAANSGGSGLVLRVKIRVPLLPWSRIAEGLSME